MRLKYFSLRLIYEEKLISQILNIILLLGPILLNILSLATILGSLAVFQFGTVPMQVKYEYFPSLLALKSPNVYWH